MLEKYEGEKKTSPFQYMVYSFSALPMLLEKMKQRDSILDEQCTIDKYIMDRYSVRFVVENDGTMWFAFIGMRGDEVKYLPNVMAQEQSPAHSDMLPRDRVIIATGEVVFSKDYQKIRGLINAGGHHRPPPGTLVFPLASLLHLGADFAPEVEFRFLWKNEQKKLKQKRVSLPATELHTLLPEGCLVPQKSTYKILVHSCGAWKSFGQGETPCFQTKIESMLSNSFNTVFKRLFSMMASLSRSTSPPRAERQVYLKKEEEPFSDSDLEDKN